MAYGDIGARRDIEEFDLVSASYTTALQIAPGIIALWCYGGAGDGIVRTYPISATGVIGLRIDEWIFDAGLYVGSDWDYSAVHVDGDVYAVAYRGAGNTLYVKTMTIASNGTITHAAIATVNFPGYPIGVHFGSFCKKTDTHIYLATWHTNPGGRVAAIHINDDGTGISSPSSWAYDVASVADYAVIRYHTGDIFILVGGPLVACCPAHSRSRLAASGNERDHQLPVNQSTNHQNGRFELLTSQDWRVALRLRVGSRTTEKPPRHVMPPTTSGTITKPLCTQIAALR